MKILIISRQIRSGNVLQQSGRDRVDLRDRVVPVGRVGRGIEDLDRPPTRCAGGITCPRKVALPLQQCRNSRKLIERILSAFAVVIDEEERLGSTVIDLWNIERATDGAAETVLR